MSRNLGLRSCYFCLGSVELDETPREVTQAEVGPYYETPDGWGFKGMICANASCRTCEAEYLAWVSLSACPGYRYREEHVCENGYFDLSFRSTFNDEPGDRDRPKKFHWLREMGF